MTGVSGGGPYSWATAATIPQRVKGVLIFSGAGPLSECYWIGYSKQAAAHWRCLVPGVASSQA